MSDQGPRPHAKIAGCAGQHVAPPADDAEDLQWYEIGRLEPVRVIAHTCPRCDSTSYEFCLVGGRYLIRRTAGSSTWDTPRVSRNTADQWWQDLLGGRAA
jgi:hypothetical protein